MRLVVTGASGNVGTALLRRLATSEHDLVAVARRPPPPVAPYDRARWLSADLSEPRSEAVLAEAVRGADAVVHLAWGFQPSHDVGYLERLGVGGTRRVAQAVLEAGVPHLVHMSSVGAYSAKRDDARVVESWPTQGLATSAYSRHKAAAERVLDMVETEAAAPVVTRLRPGLIGQALAGSELLRYGLPPAVPAAVLRHLPLLPLDRRLTVPVVHADDVAEAIVRALERRAEGAFNLAAEPPVTADMGAQALGARIVPVPAKALSLLAQASWYAHLQPVDRGWVDLAYGVPLLDCSRAREVLGWQPTRDAEQVLHDTLGGMVEALSGRSPVLRPRRVVSELARWLRRGRISERRLP
ncbi:NAD-dependent epimerase/dehydratase family protein [Angustibacter sp. Root456]|uniref:NAD-dependent epimerase/dehydratase family protein n=1 Tax=Angustibacter sp. Root456 TaxID=1736539 RepID=UPI0006F74CEA|nr:NAD-dependent epimerase/dehydratase family protein [Angustibacter sp. Root456]KQX66289.1 epimerase [Angustibacter sp. Root456]